MLEPLTWLHHAFTSFIADAGHELAVAPAAGDPRGVYRVSSLLALVRDAEEGGRVSRLLCGEHYAARDAEAAQRDAQLVLTALEKQQLCVSLGDRLRFPSALSPLPEEDERRLWLPRDEAARRRSWHVARRRVSLRGGRPLPFTLVPLVQAVLHERVSAFREAGPGAFEIEQWRAYEVVRSERACVLLAGARDGTFSHVDVAVRCSTADVAARALEEALCAVRERAVLDRKSRNAVDTGSEEVLEAPLCPQCLYQSGTRSVVGDDASAAAAACGACLIEWDALNIEGGVMYTTLRPWTLPRVEAGDMLFDVFLSHAGPDKPLVVELYLFLSAFGFRCFYDQTCIVNDIWQGVAPAGVACSALMVAELSRAYFDSARSTWPQLEGVSMRLSRSRERGDGKSLVYPVFVTRTPREAQTMGALVERADGTPLLARDGRSPECAGHLLGASLGCEAPGAASLSLAQMKKVAGDLCARGRPRRAAARVERAPGGRVAARGRAGGAARRLRVAAKVAARGLCGSGQALVRARGPA